METIHVVVVVQGLAIAFLGVLVVGLLRAHADVLRALDRLGAGVDDEATDPQPILGRPGTATDIAGVGIDGEAIAVSMSTGADPVLLAFLSSSCASCDPFWKHFASGRLEGPVPMRIVAVTLGPDEESPTRIAKATSPRLTTVMSSAAWARYGAPGAPYFVVVDPETRQIIGEGQALLVDQLQSFIADATADRLWTQDRTSKAAADLARERRVDRDLLRAGLTPGDPQLYPQRGDTS